MPNYFLKFDDDMINVRICQGNRKVYPDNKTQKYGPLEKAPDHVVHLALENCRKRLEKHLRTDKTLLVDCLIMAADEGFKI